VREDPVDRRRPPAPRAVPRRELGKRLLGVHPPPNEADELGERGLAVLVHPPEDVVVIELRVPDIDIHLEVHRQRPAAQVRPHLHEVHGDTEQHIVVGPGDARVGAQTPEVEACISDTSLQDGALDRLGGAPVVHDDHAVAGLHSRRELLLELGVVEAPRHRRRLGPTLGDDAEHPRERALADTGLRAWTGGRRRSDRDGDRADAATDEREIPRLAEEARDGLHRGDDPVEQGSHRVVVLDEVHHGAAPLDGRLYACVRGRTFARLADLREGAESGFIIEPEFVLHESGCFRQITWPSPSVINEILKRMQS
jgi:hypothetical protein